MEDNAMCMYIGIEDLAANALIGILARTQPKDGELKFVRFATLLDYGMAVIRKLKKDSGEDATLIYNRESNSMLFTDYSDFFERHTDDDGYDGIRLRKGKNEHDLFLRFIGSIPVELQNIMADNALISRYVLKKAA